MPQIENWSRLPAAIRDHLVERMHDRNIGVTDLNQLRVWIESKPNVSDGQWYKDFGSFNLCGEGKFPKTFLLTGQGARGPELQATLVLVKSIRRCDLQPLHPHPQPSQTVFGARH